MPSSARRVRSARARPTRKSEPEGLVLHRSHHGAKHMNTKSIRQGLVMGALTLGALACGAQQPERENQFLAGVPEQGALQLSITDDAASEALATQDDQVGAAVSSELIGSLGLHLEPQPAAGLA